MSQNPIRNAIAVASGKGGVGKSTVAVNIAVALSQAGSRVGLLDADIYGPNVPTMMGIRKMSFTPNQKLIPPKAHGVKVISIGFMVPEDQPLIWRGPMLHKAIQQFIQDVEWGELDYLIVDLPPGTGDVQLSLAQSMPLAGGIIVTLPQKVSVEDARRGLEMFRTMEVPILGIVENMGSLKLDDGTQMDIFGTGGGKSLAEDTQIPLIGEIPLDPIVRKGGDSGIPVVLSHPDSEVAQVLVSIAETLATKIAELEEKGSSFVSIEMID